MLTRCKHCTDGLATPLSPEPCLSHFLRGAGHWPRHHIHKWWSGESTPWGQPPGPYSLGCTVPSPQSVRPTTLTAPQDSVGWTGLPKGQLPTVLCSGSSRSRSLLPISVVTVLDVQLVLSQCSMKDMHPRIHGDTDTAGTWLPFQVMPQAGSLAEKPHREQRWQTL